MVDIRTDTRRTPDEHNIALGNNLPVQTMPFIGRGDEITAIAQRLADPACGLLTLVGPGGMGKTRLAIEVAKHIAQTDPSADSIYFVDLQPVKSGKILVTAIANALGVLLSGSEDPRAQLLSYLNERTSLLLLDNFEQLLDSVDLLGDILKIAPDVKLLVTSREALNLHEEWVWQVGGLQVPDQQSEAAIESYSAVQLFAERARRIRKDFVLTGQERAITRICQLVEGMPLALELAASWLKAMSCAEIADEIQRGLDILATNTRNVPERHRSMQAVYDHSWRLLSEDERRVMPRLSVFRGGFRREAAESAAGASLSTLSGLVAKSFLRVSADGRYDIHELIRQYADEHLAAVPSAKEDAQYQHCVYYARFLHQRQRLLRGREQARALDEIEDELDNIRVSWEWAVEHGMAHEIHQSMHSMYLFCHIRSQTVEGERLFDLAFKRFEHDDSAMLAYILLGRVRLAGFNGRNIDANQFPRAIRLAYTFWTDDEIAMLLNVYSHFREELIASKRWDDEQQEQVCRHFLELFRISNQDWGATWMLVCLGAIFECNGRFEEAERCFLESKDSFLNIGDRWASAWPSMFLAFVFEQTGRYNEADHEWQEHQDICAEVDDRGAAVAAPTQRARLAWKQNNYHAARLFVAQGVKAYLDAGSSILQLEEVLRWLIAVLVSEGRHEHAAELSSFVRHHAVVALAPQIVNEAHQVLDSLARHLSPDAYRQAIERGKKLHLRTVLEQLYDELTEYSPLVRGAPQFDPLTERELEVLRLTAAGHSNRQIARDLFLALNTVKSHMHHIYGKLDVASRTQAVARARELHLL
jgi:predicted ATPase/DNA-binding CsgD family transcriptional regulator